MLDAFLTRLMVALADRAGATTDIGALADPVALRSKLALAQAGFRDVDRHTIADLDRLVTAKPEELGGLLMRAFWREQLAAGFKLHPVQSCLLVNPPADLTVESPAVATLSCQPYLVGKYGTVLAPGASLDPIQRLTLGASGCFDEVLVFWDRGVDLKPLLDCLTPGTTVAFFRPVREQHQFWLDWAELDYSFKLVASVVAQQFKTKLVHSATIGQLSLHIFGLEGHRT